MHISICSPNRIFRESLARVIEADCGCETHEFDSVRGAFQAGQLPGVVVVVDGYELSVEDEHFLAGAFSHGSFDLILLAPRDRILTPDGWLISSDLPLESLTSRIREVLSVRRTPMMKTARRPNAPMGLTNRQYEVALLVAKGYPNVKIADLLGMKEQSVRNLVSEILHALRCDNRVQVALELLQIPS